MDQAEVLRALAKLGVVPADLHRVRLLPYPEAVRFLDELKGRVRQSWKRLAFELHPDRTGSDPEKTVEFTLLNRVRSDFEKVTVSPPPVPMPVVFVPFRRPSYAASPFTSTSTATVSPWYVVRMRPS